MILCIGLACDETFVYTLQALKRAGVAFDALDLAQLAYSGQVEIPLEDLCSTTISLHGVHYTLNSYRGVFVRLIDISLGAPSEQLSLRTIGLYNALIRLFNAAPLPTINPTLQDCSNYAKLFHTIALASKGGWQIPRSCLTSSQEKARDFIASCESGAIFKGASATKTWATLYDVEQHASRLPFLAACPVLFQERIVGPDVRIHIIGEHAFAEVIESTDLDYRCSRTNAYRSIDPPPDIIKGCRMLTQDCNIPFLGIDFKIQLATEEWFFLEANSLPCYQGYDRRANGAISRAIVDWLMSAR